MTTLARRTQRRTDIWPGFVDALATLLMVIIFLLMIFVLAQFFLSEALSGRDTALDRLRGQVSELAELLALERGANTELRRNIAQISEELQASVARGDDLIGQMRTLTLRAETAEEKTGHLEGNLAAAREAIDADKERLDQQVGEIADLTRSIEALRALKAEMESEISELAAKAEQRDGALLAEREISESARAQVALLNQQIRALRQQLAQIETVLELSEKLNEEQKIQIANLGQRLNAALATKVQELSRYRSEFFGRLREVLGGEKDIRVVGDRFVFQSEVLFSTASDELGPEGREQMERLARTLTEISAKIPATISWILRVDGHTDNIPIRTARFPSNWELSTARAISVVKFLIDQGISPERLAATGFGEYQPIDPRDDEIGRRRNRRIELKLTER
jgi:chemotaxis protein MotB